MLELHFINLYREKFEAKQAERAGITRKDVVAELTGGGVTTAGVHALAEVLGGILGIEQGLDPQPAYRGPWQNEIVEWIGAHTYNTVQAPRRLGKSYSVSLWATAYMCAGYRVIMAMPTMQQGSRLIFRQVSRNIWRLSTIFPELFKRVIDNATNILLENAGELTILSADKGAEKEGYGCEYLIVDEAHKCEVSTLAVFQPFADDAVEQGIGRVSLIGIGGPEESAIELMQTEPEGLERDPLAEETAVAPETRYAGLRMDADDLVKLYPQLEGRFARARSLLSIDEYNQHYRCKTVPIGTRMVYPGLQRYPSVKMETDTPRYVFGIDVGKKKDATIICTLRVKESKQLGVKVLELIDFHEIRGSNYPAQGQSIMDYIWKFYPEARQRELNNICIETNGPGEPLADILEENLGIVDLQRSWTDEKWKRYTIRDLQQGARQGWFACPDSIAHRQLVALSYEIDGFGKEKWEHNDLHSALLKAAEIA